MGKQYQYFKHLFLLISFFISVSLHAENLRHVVILQTSDIHSHIYGADAGWLRIASLIEAEKKHAGGKENVLLIDCGDTVTGTMIAYLSRGMAGAAILNALEYDAWIIGNHDFELGAARLQELCRYVNADKLAGNLEWQPKIVKPWKLYKKNGIDIALIGLTSPHLSEWLWGPEMKKIKTSHLIKSLDRIMLEVIKAKPDMIILATHHGRFSPAILRGINMSKVARKYPQIDLILGGHTHLEVPGEKIGADSWYVLCGAHGEKLAKIDAWVDIESGRVKEIKSKLLSLSHKIPQNAKCAALVEEWHRQTMIFSGKQVGENKIKIKEMDKLFGRAIAETANTSVAIISPPVKGVKFPNLVIYEKDLFKAEPYDDTVCVLFLNKDEIKKIISEQIKYIKKAKFQSCHGLSVIRGKSGTLSIEFADGNPWSSESERIAVAFSSYTLAGAGGRFPVLKKIAMKPDSRGRNTAILIRDALRSYIRKHYPIKEK